LFKILSFVTSLFILFLPMRAKAQGVDIPKPTRPSRVTVAQTQPVGATLPDPEEEATRAASIATSPQNPLNSFISPISPLTILSNTLNMPLTSILPPQWFGFSTALNPTALGESFNASSLLLPNLTAMMPPAAPPQFLLASSPESLLTAGLGAATRQAHLFDYGLLDYGLAGLSLGTTELASILLGGGYGLGFSAYGWEGMDLSPYLPGPQPWLGAWPSLTFGWPTFGTFSILPTLPARLPSSLPIFFPSPFMPMW
jgi:hypothetical protein